MGRVVPFSMSQSPFPKLLKRTLFFWPLLHSFAAFHVNRWDRRDLVIGVFDYFNALCRWVLNVPKVKAV